MLLVLLYEEIKSALIAIKAATEITQREDIYNIIMQGSVLHSSFEPPNALCGSPIIKSDVQNLPSLHWIV